jgi:hypothetical protein
MGSDNPDENITSAIVERIDSDDDGISDWVVFAGLKQELWYTGGAKVEWFTGFAPEDRVQIPNAYRLFGCRDQGRSEADPNERADGPVFAIQLVCRSLRKNGSLAPGDTGK